MDGQGHGGSELSKVNEEAVKRFPTGGDALQLGTDARPERSAARNINARGPATRHGCPTSTRRHALAYHPLPRDGGAACLCRVHPSDSPTTTTAAADGAAPLSGAQHATVETLSGLARPQPLDTKGDC